MVKGPTVALVLAIALVGLAAVLGTRSEGVTFTVWVKALKPDGSPLPHASVAFYELTEKGAAPVAGGLTDLNGELAHTLTLPKGRVVLNLLVAVSGADGNTTYYGSWAVPLHVYMKERHVEVVVRTRAVKARPSSVPSGALPALLPPLPDLALQQPYQVVGEKWEYTPVLEFRVQELIEAGFDYPTGAIIAVQSKSRYWDCMSGTCVIDSDWADSGYTGVSLDRGYKSGVSISASSFRLSFQFKYVDVLIYTGTPGLYEERVYAADTDSDGYRVREESSYWNGGPPSSYVNYAITYQGKERELPTTRAYAYVWYPTVTIPVSYPWGINVSIDLPLGVNNVEYPAATLKINVPVVGGNRVAWSYDESGGWLRSTHVWGPPP